MKTHTLLPTLAVASLVILPALSQEKKKADEVDPFAAGSPADPKELRKELPKLIQVQVEWIEMSHEALTDLLFLHDPKGDSTQLRVKVQKMVKEEGAKILETAICLARPGQKATTESIREHIYPTEYEPMRMPGALTVEGQFDDEALSQIRTPATPTAFETRNVGTTLEIEPNIGADDKIIDLRMQPEIVIETGESVWQSVKDGQGNETEITMPLFYSLRTSTGLTMLDGQYRFVGVVTPQGDDGEADRTRKVMMFVKCDVVAIGEEAIGK